MLNRNARTFNETKVNIVSVHWYQHANHVVQQILPQHLFGERDEQVACNTNSVHFANSDTRANARY